MRFALICLSTLISVGAAEAQCATRNSVVTRSYTPSYQATTYTYDNVVVPIALPLAVPAFSFQYVPPTCTPAPKAQTEIQLAAPEPPLRKEDIRNIVRQVIEESRRTDVEDDGPPVNTSKAREPIQYLQQTEIVKPNPKSAFAQAAINGLYRNCASCHTGFGSKGEAMIFSTGNILNPDAPFTSILKELKTKHMPPKNSGLQPTLHEVQSMVAWLEGR